VKYARSCSYLENTLSFIYYFIIQPLPPPPRGRGSRGKCPGDSMGAPQKKAGVKRGESEHAEMGRLKTVKKATVNMNCMGG